MVIKSIFLRADTLFDIENKLNGVLERLALTPKQIIKVYYNAVVIHNEEIMNTVILMYSDTTEEKEEYSRTDTLGQYKKVFKD